MKIHYAWIYLFILVNTALSMDRAIVPPQKITARQLQQALDCLRTKRFFSNTSQSYFGMVYLDAQQICQEINKDQKIQKRLRESTNMSIVNDFVRLINEDSSAADQFQTHIDSCLKHRGHNMYNKDSESDRRLAHSYDETLTGGSPDGLFGEFELDLSPENNSL